MRRRWCFVTLMMSLIVPSLRAQTPAGTPPGGNPLPWAAVSIRPSDPARNHESDGWRDQPNGITGQGISLNDMISQAYSFSVMPFREEEVEGLPPWAKIARYDLRARVDAEDVEGFRKLSGLPMSEMLNAFTARLSTGEMLMGQAMLAERFHLKAHYESRSRAVYVLTVDRNGPRLKPTSAEPNHGEMQFGDGTLSGKGVPVAFIATLLAVPAERYVVDRTSLAGRFDFELHFTPNNEPAGAESSTEAGFFPAVRQQLGLKLQSDRADVPVLVIDHIEEPTPN